MSFVFQFYKQEQGGATHYIMTNITEEQIAKKKCLINVKNRDNSCFVIALGVAMAQRDKVNGNITEDKYKYIVKHCCKPTSVKRFQELYTAVGMEIDTKVSIGDIKRFEEHLQTTINIFTSEGHRYPIDLENQFENQVHLFLHNDHYYIITSPEAFLNLKETKKFCNGCKKAVSKATHKCETTGVFVKQLCLRCGEIHKNEFGEIVCDDCNRVFVSTECFDNHKKKEDKVDSNGTNF